MKTKRLIPIALGGLFLAGAFAGCSPEEPEYVEENATVLNLWAHSFEDWADELLTQQVNEFNKIPDDGIQIELRFYGDDNTYDTAIAAGFENDNLADILMAQYDRIYTYLRAGYIAPVQEFLTETEVNDFVDVARDAVTYADPKDGVDKMYAIPWTLEPSMMLFYKKDVFERAGIDKVPASWDELYAACEKIIAAGEVDSRLNQYALGIPTAAGELTWSTYGMLQDVTGGLVVDESWKKSRLPDNEAGFSKCAEFWYNLSKNKYSPIASMSASGYADVIDAFGDGQLAMTLCGSWGFSRMYQYYPEQIDNLGVAEMPTADGDQSGITTCNGGWTYVITSKASAEKQRLASQFLRWYLLNTDVSSVYYRETFNSKAPTTKSLMKYLEENPVGGNPEWIALVNKVAEKGIMPPSNAWAVNEQVGQLFEYMLGHAKDDGANFTSLFRSKYDDVKAAVENIISQSTYEGNPKYKGEA